jgi:hypothetical protein
MYLALNQRIRNCVETFFLSTALGTRMTSSVRMTLLRANLGLLLALYIQDEALLLELADALSSPLLLALARACS